MPTRKHSADDERGSGLVSTMFGAVAFLAFLMLATNVLVGLYATSVTTSVAWDAARAVAMNADDPTTVQRAEKRAGQQLHSLRKVRFQWMRNDGQVGLRVSAQKPGLLPPSLLRSTRLTTIDRTVWVREELAR